MVGLLTWVIISKCALKESVLKNGKVPRFIVSKSIIPSMQPVSELTNLLKTLVGIMGEEWRANRLLKRVADWFPATTLFSQRTRTHPSGLRGRISSLFRLFLISRCLRIFLFLSYPHFCQYYTGCPNSSFWRQLLMPQCVFYSSSFYCVH